MSFFYMMDDLRYPFFSFFFCGGDGWSSSRWLFGTQLVGCHAVGLAVPQTSAATFGGERSDCRVSVATKATVPQHRQRVWGGNR